MTFATLIHFAAGQPASCGAIVSLAWRTRRQSSPSMSAESCAADNRITPFSIFGQRNWPSSSRLANRQTPVPSHGRPRAPTAGASEDLNALRQALGLRYVLML
jgi:hypothetical protein